MSLPALVIGQLIWRGFLIWFVIFMPAQYGFLNEVVLLERGKAVGQFKRSRQLSAAGSEESCSCAGSASFFWVQRLRFASG